MQAETPTALESRQRVRKALRLLGIYFSIRLVLAVLFEWHNAVYGGPLGGFLFFDQDMFPFFYGLFFFSFLAASLITSIKMQTGRRYGTQIRTITWLCHIITPLATPYSLLAMLGGVPEQLDPNGFSSGEAPRNALLLYTPAY
jgi:hypothetical protein